VAILLAEFGICADHNRWDEMEKASKLNCCLIDDAGQLIWDSVQHHLLMEKLSRSTGQIQGVAKTWRMQLYQDIRGLMTRAYPGHAMSDR
jgi:hypothetical protein